MGSGVETCGVVGAGAGVAAGVGRGAAAATGAGGLGAEGGGVSGGAGGCGRGEACPEGIGTFFGDVPPHAVNNAVMTKTEACRQVKINSWPSNQQ